MKELAIRIPATIVNILINPIGVGFDQLDHALSISNALITNAPPKILTRTANISAVNQILLQFHQSTKEFLELLKKTLNI